ncbi:MAG: NAD-dependent epimerase/dehydratase family protein [Acidimicrobiales bacterium]|nr:NAD-dependent epimerase/dehydratase family protein [Acidimicrobiales bacterium]
MRVAVTGATGLVGSHCVAAALTAGHEVRMVVRNPAKAKATLGLHGLNDDAIQVFEADLTDHDSLRASLVDIDGLIHAGAVFSLDPRDAQTMREVNPTSTKVLLDEAANLGLHRIVHVSSMGVYAANLTDITPESTVGPESGPYTSSKIAADAVAAAHQEAGQPVVIVCPGGILGPLDPNPGLSDSMAAIRDWIRLRAAPMPRSIRFSFVDVRDVATACVGSLTDGVAPARHLLAGHIHGMAEILNMASRLTGRKVRVLSSPLWVITLGGAICDLVGRATGNKMPLTRETAYLTVTNARAGGLQSVDQHSASQAFGFPSRSIDETLADTIRWLHTTGHLTTEQAGILGT